MLTCGEWPDIGPDAGQDPQLGQTLGIARMDPQATGPELQDSRNWNLDLCKLPTL